jgi:hypothetical protein
MPRIQVHLPDGLYRDVKRRGMSPSELLQAAVRAELERLEKVAELERYLAELGPELGKPSAADKAWARAVRDRVRRHLRGGGARRAS